MLKAHARTIAALMLGAAIALPAVTWAQAPAATSPTPPTTAPTKNAGNVPVAPQVETPKVASPPTPTQGSTAVPGWNNPPSWAAASERPQYASIPGVDRNRLIQGAGREWREFRNGPLTQVGGWVVVLALALVLLVFLVRGRIRLHGAPTGRMIERFNAVERASHWTMALSFVFLALTGVVMFFGKYLVLPWLGYNGFSWLTIVSKNIHNFVGPLFIFSLLVSFLVFVKDNFFHGRDFTWLAKLGNMFSRNKPEIPSGRFNGGEKLWFWGGLVLLGAFVSVTGVILDFPNWNQGREAMQLSNVIHVAAAMLFIAGAFAHIYMGVAVEGAYAAMRDGYVDEEWAREHHSLWYEEVKAGRRPERIVGGTVQPVAGDD